MTSSEWKEFEAIRPRKLIGNKFNICDTDIETDTDDNDLLSTTIDAADTSYVAWLLIKGIEAVTQ